MTIDACLDLNIGQRRIFWTTRPACGEYTICGEFCSIPGLEYKDEAAGRTIVNEGWLQSLILNILNTRARTDQKCPAPFAVFGHWSESYRGDGMYIGSTLYNAAEKSYIRTADAAKGIGVAIQADLSKLTMLGVVDSVKVETTYRGRNRVDVLISVYVKGQGVKVNLSGQFVTGTWIWTEAQ